MNAPAISNRLRTHSLVAAATACLALTACSRGADDRHGIHFPSDSDIAQALQVDLDKDPNSAKAREMVKTLGGDQGTLDYKVQKVIYRQGAFEAHYGVSLRMARSGEESLQRLYASMIPADALKQIPEQTLASYEKWLADSAASMEKSDPRQAAALKASLESLGKCYRQAKANDRVELMAGLTALISPARDGWYADKLQSPSAQLHCLPL
ncbi:conserved exported hypothetical protein [Burkholderiales bacterium 8X]|nr:conserved exported hypothetical protein [Burkholderiales bacterium 8X]